MRLSRRAVRTMVVAGAMAFALGAGAWQYAPVSSAVVPSPVDEQVGTTATPASFADVIEAVKPSVVNISAAGHLTDAPMQDQRWPPEFDDFFRRFFDRQSATAGDGAHGPRAMGSGFIVDPSGLVVTNNHVIAGASEITVTLNDGTQLPATLVGTDPKTDLALLEVAAERPLPYATFGDSDAARVGDWVLAIGNPFGLGGTATTGIVSARGRDIQSGPFDDFLQIDAPINKGNSGGPLFDATGRVIGVNTAIFSPNGGNVGIGFAIPSSQAGPIIDALRANGHVERGWLGVQIQAVDDDIAAGLGLTEAAGALVASVVDDSPAAEAGFEPGDVITAFDGEPVATIRDLTRAVASTGPSRDVDVEVWRDEQRQQLSVSLGTSPDANAAVTSPRPGSDADASSALGLRLAPLTPELRSGYRVADGTDGVLVVEVRPGSAADTKGVRSGDVILRVGGDAVSEPAEIAREVDAARESDRGSVVFQIARGEARQFIAVPLA